MKQRKHYTAEQKLIILQELLENNVPISQLAEKYEAHTNDICNWKNKLFESAIDIFTPKISSPKQTSIEQKEIEKLQAEVDKRIIINDDECYVFFFFLLGNLWRNKITTGLVYNSLHFCWRYRISIKFILVSYIQKN